jgi:broad specificity phosphatase PhoE/predicted kinase
MMFPLARPLVLVMVGLPARGKTYLARKLTRYLTWHGYRAEVFNVGNYRRARLGADQPATFFDPSNPEGRAAREGLAEAALDDLLAWVRAGGQVAIYDATNSTRARRATVRRRLAEEGLVPIFVESATTDAALVEANVRETKLSSPDYRDKDPDSAMADFRARIAHYERAYEPVDDPDGSYVKIIDIGRKIIAHRISGYLPAQLVSYLSNLHVTPRPIYLTRHGESEYNLDGRVGGDPELTDRGMGYVRHLSQFLQRALAEAGEPPQVWCSTLRRAMITAGALPWNPVSLRSLDEIDAGACDGWTYDEIAARLPEDARARASDKLRYRYPRGESYLDVIQRVQPVVVEIERQRAPVVVVAHNAVIRVLYGYFTGRLPEEVPRLEIPLHTVIRLVPKAYGADEQRFELGP